jgi:hypothetical protein
MSSILTKGILRNGRVEVDKPIDLPDGTELLISLPNGVADSDDDGPMTPEEIARVLAAMEKVEPFDMTPEEEAEIEAGRQQRKAYTIANMHKGVEDLFK